MGSRQTHLLANTKSFDDRAISIHILYLQVIEKAAPLAHHPQQPSARMVILGVNLEMVRQIVDLFTQDRDLYFGRTGIGDMNPVAVNDFVLPLSG